MKTLILAVATLLFVSCGSSFDFTGAWANEAQYQNWKNGIDEGMGVTETEIDGKIYSVLTNSIMINTHGNKPIFSVPGGQWNLELKKINRLTYEVLLGAEENPAINGSLVANVVGKASVYFTAGEMSNEFIKEFQQSFLLLGKEFRYVRCDRK